MAKNKDPRDLSVNELRRLLIEKRRSGRHERIERYRETGRIVRLVSDEEETSWDDIRTTFPEGEGPQDPVDESRKRGKRVVDGFLLTIEILAVLGLIFVLFNGLDILQELNREVALALEQPTLTPTPLIVAVVLPSGHTPPDSPGGSKPNMAEIPEHLQPVVQSFGEIPIPTQGPQHAIRLQIPKINQDVPIVEGDGFEQLKKGVGHHINSANPGEPGNVVLSAHNDIHGEIFRHLDQLETGDLIIIFSERQSYTYVVEDVLFVEPTQVEFLASTGEPTATLISCYPYMIDNKRIVVIANLIDS
ncbi:MAG: class D sortase [Anaerolineales bacterium]|nr:class D sortase [Anaerolineales bacterium]